MAAINIISWRAVSLKHCHVY